VDDKTRRRAHELEREAHTVHPATAINRLCVIVATLEGNVEPARSGHGNRGIPLYRHECGHVESLSAPPEDGGCDACESGSPDPADWQPLYVAAVRS
jgi:hypothetical protein